MHARETRPSRIRVIARWLAVAAALAGPAAAQNPPLDRDLGAYHIFGLRSVNLKNFTLLGACNVGVGCAKPSANSDCGVLSQEDAFYADGSQVAGDNAKFTKAGASVWQLFSNEVGSPANVTVRLPGSNTDGSDPLAPLPIIGDLDGDLAPSCRTQGGQCVVDAGDLERACAFPTTFPACNAAKPVVVLGDADCKNVADGAMGNGRCDLAPGVYGAIEVQNQGKVTLQGGTYVFCAVSVGKNTSVIAANAAAIYVTGDFGINNEASVGQQCGDIAVFAKGPGSFGFGRNSSIAGFFCAPERLIQLGHDNDLTGQFVADQINSDSNNRGHCCAADDCACFDGFTPAAARVGDTLILRGGCGLGAVTAVRLCGIDAPILSQTGSEIRVTVPPGAAGPCSVQAESPSGVFTAASTLTVT